MSNSVFLPKNSESHQNISRSSVANAVNSNSEPARLKEEIDHLLNELQRQHQSVNALSGGSSEDVEEYSQNDLVNSSSEPARLKREIDHLLNELQSKHNLSAQSGGKKSSRKGSKKSSRKSSRKGSKKSSRKGSKKSSKKMITYEQLGGVKKGSKKSSRKGSKKSSKKGSRKGSKSSKKLIEAIFGGAPKISKKSSKKGSKKSSRKSSRKCSKKSSKKSSKRSMKRELPLAIVKGNEFKDYIQKDMKLKGGPVLMTFTYMIWNEYKKAHPNDSPEELFKGSMNLYNNYKKSGSLNKMYDDAEKRFIEKKAAKKAEKKRNLSESS